VAPLALAGLLLFGASATSMSETGTPAVPCAVVLSDEDRVAVESYRGVVRLYREGHEKEALAERANWFSRPLDRATTMFVLLGEHPECLEPNRLETRDVEAAALLETDRALDEHALPSDASGRDAALRRAERLMEVATRGAGPDRRCRWMQAVALYYHGADALESAGQWYERSLSLCARDAETLLALGLVHERRATRNIHGLGCSLDSRTGVPGAASPSSAELATAEGYYRRALEIAPGHTELRLRLARTRQVSGKPSEAVTELQDVLAQTRVEPGTVYVAELMLGAIHEAAGRLEPAVGCYRAALSAEPRAQVATIALSQALHRVGRHIEAGRVLAGWLEDASGLPPNDIDDWLTFELGTPARTATRPHERLLGRLRQELAR
jgi:tetratricopeptide (TPR) repeat protein